MREADPAARNDAIRGALNAFGATTGPSLSFIIDAERRGIESATADAKALTSTLRLAAAIAAAAASRRSC